MSTIKMEGIWYTVYNTMKPYRELDHPAELRIQVEGDTVEHLFVNAVEALADILSPNRYANIASTETIEVESVDRDAALVDFLNELLARSHTEKSVFIPGTVTLSSEEEKMMVKGVMRRYLVPAFDQDIKAVTHQDMHIDRNNGMYRTAIVFDI